MYKIRLPLKSRIYPIVHVSLLKLANKDIPLVTDKVKQEGTDKYKVERILDSETSVSRLSTLLSRKTTYDRKAYGN